MCLQRAEDQAGDSDGDSPADNTVEIELAPTSASCVGVSTCGIPEEGDHESNLTARAKSVLDLRFAPQSTGAAAAGSQSTMRASVFAVADGDHAAVEAATESILQSLPAALKTTASMHEPTSASFAAQVLSDITAAFQEADRRLESDGLADVAGCSAVACVLLSVPGGQRLLFTANVGSCHAVMGTNGSAFRLTEEHTHGAPAPHLRRMSTLAVGDGEPRTRSIGHRSAAGRVGATPSTSRTVLRPGDACFIMASDAVWNVLTDEEAVDTVYGLREHGASPQDCADAVIDLAKDGDELLMDAALPCASLVVMLEDA